MKPDLATTWRRNSKFLKEQTLLGGMLSLMGGFLTAVVAAAANPEMQNGPSASILGMIVISSMIVLFLAWQVRSAYLLYADHCADTLRCEARGTWRWAGKQRWEEIRLLHGYRHASSETQETFRGIVQELEKPPTRKHLQAARTLTGKK